MKILATVILVIAGISLPLFYLCNYLWNKSHTTKHDQYFRAALTFFMFAPFVGGILGIALFLIDARGPLRGILIFFGGIAGFVLLICVIFFLCFSVPNLIERVRWTPERAMSELGYDGEKHMFPYKDVYKEHLAKSNMRASTQPPPDDSESVFFSSQNIKMIPIPAMSEEAQVVHAQTKHDLDESVHRVYEIHVLFSIHNNTDEKMYIFDFHTQLYQKRSGSVKLTLGLDERHRIELYADNSITDSGMVLTVKPREAAFFDLCFEASYQGHWESATAVFGITAEYEMQTAQGVDRYTLPSDALYAVQNWEESKSYSAVVLSRSYMREKIKSNRLKLASLNDTYIRYKNLLILLEKHQECGVRQR